MIRLDNKKSIIGFDDGYQLGKTANFILDNGVHFLGSAEPTLKENSLFYDKEKNCMSASKYRLCIAFSEKTVKIYFCKMR